MVLIVLGYLLACRGAYGNRNSRYGTAKREAP
jgi:hypothetical protein